MLEKIGKTPFLEIFDQSIKEESSLLFEKLWDCPKAILALKAQKALGTSVLIITGGDRQEKLLDDLQFFHGKESLEFPSWEILPSEDLPPNPDIVGKRFEILHKIGSSQEPQIVVTSLQAALQKLISKKQLEKHFHIWKVKDLVDFDQIETFLSELGYRKSPITQDKGQFSIRGGILDLFPVCSPCPYRIEFFDIEIDRIRSFDPLSQKSIEKVSEIFISPACELSLLKGPGELCLLKDYFSSPPLVIFDDLLALEDKWVQLKNLPGFTSQFFISLENFLESLNGYKKIFFSSQSLEDLSSVIAKEKKGAQFYSGQKPLQEVLFEIFNKKIHTKRALHPFARIDEFFLPPDTILEDPQEELLSGINFYKDHNLKLHFITASESESSLLKKQIEELEIALPVSTEFLHGYLTSGCVLLDSNHVFFPYTELSHRYKVRRKKWRNSYQTPPSEFHELTIGDLVVHFHNGVGKFIGIDKQKNHLGHIDEFIVIEYAGDSKLFVPLSQSHLVSRYIGTKEEKPILHTLGTTKWQVARAKAENAIMGYAKDLLALQAQREAKGGFIYPEDGEETLLFEEEFPFIETEDQLKAISQIKEDMCSKKAMDRLVCGDVGYGKTEVAMRAAFKAVCDGKKQVALLVPTTTLAMQHLDSFKERMANFKIKIEGLSRLNTPKESKKILEDLKEGSIDILIGTHRLISKDIAFKNLGLLIIDEEQHFGVRAKESLKKLKVGVDCITLSATPIPRTLHMSIIGAKDLSVINTPPQDRLPIKTIVCEADPTIIKNALLRELSRDGQIYYIHNRVETIYQKKEELESLVPTAKMKVVHGQMDSDEIDEIFHGFKTGLIQVLIATTIVESGIDIPNANTILIEKADTFGLADLYQLRGRVGRWNRPAYAYFLTPRNRELPEVAKKRLQALVETSGFGGGMKLAMKDLEIRGAGDILGVQQSGQICTVGFHLYCKLLKRAVSAIHKNTKASFIETKIEFAFPASLPESYIPETSLRLEIYHRLGEATQFDTLDEIFKELEDRFGKHPKEVIWLYHMTRIRIFGQSNDLILLKFEKVTFQAHRQEKDKSITKKTIPLPNFDLPKQLEDYVCMMLRHQFKL